MVDVVVALTTPWIKILIFKIYIWWYIFFYQVKFKFLYILYILVLLFLFYFIKVSILGRKLLLSTMMNEMFVYVWATTIKISSRP
jgi:hypothetical protein